MLRVDYFIDEIIADVTMSIISLDWNEEDKQ